MSKFVTRIYEPIRAREQVDQLFIDEIGVMDDFEASLKGTQYNGEFKTLLRYIEHFANGNSVGDKVTYLKGVKDGVTEYEFRSKHLRIYAIQQPGKKILMFGGTKKKADSSDNIEVFRSLKKRYDQQNKLIT